MKEKFFIAINTLTVIKELMIGISHLLRNYETHKYLEETEDFCKQRAGTYYLLAANEKENYLQKHTKYKTISFEKEN